MANRYPDRPYSADRQGQSDPYRSDEDENDPLAELARLIGQTDPLGTMGRANAKVPSPPVRSAPRRNDDQTPSEPDDLSPAGPPRWMQRGSVREVPGEIPREPPRDTQREAYREVESPSYPSPVHPLRRYAQPPAPQPDPRYQEPPYQDQAYQDESSYAEEEGQLDPSRYDDALYGQVEAGAQDFQREPAYPDDPYAYQGAYGDEAEEAGRKKRSGIVTVAAILALAVVGGIGAAFAYRIYFAAPRSGEPPIIRADTSPTKIFPAKATTLKVADRLTSGDGTEKLVPREEAPLDLNTQSGRQHVVLPPLNQDANLATPSSVPPGTMPATQMATAGAAPGNGTWASTDPRPIKTIIVRGNQPDGDALPVNGAPSQPAASAEPAAPPEPAAVSAPAPSKPPVAARRTSHRPSVSTVRESANAPLSLSPQPASHRERETRVASANPAEIIPGGGGNYLVQISSQRSEADARASFRALQRKFPSVLGSQSPVIKRVDVRQKGVYYRAMVGPFGTSGEAARFCRNLKEAGGQCFVQRN